MSDSHNPWISPDERPNEDEPASRPVEDGLHDIKVETTGPVAPQPGNGITANGGLPVRTTAEKARLWWVGAHGGAGETTLSKLLNGSRDAHHAWPVPANPELGSSAVVLCCRTNAAGLQAAQEALTQWASGAVPGVQLLGLVLIADAPTKLPKALKEYSKLVGGGAPRTWDLPWVEEWRTDSPATNSDLRSSNRKLRRFIRSAEHLIT